MFKQTLLLSILCLLLIASCKTTNNSASVAAPVNDTISDFSNPKVSRDKELYAATKELVPVDTVYLTKDTLHILTKKILGCDADNFKLFWNGAMMKSLPPQTSVKLFQQVNTDCKEQHRFHLTYNITSLRIKHDTASFNTDSCLARTTVLRLGGYKEAVKYEY